MKKIILFILTVAVMLPAVSEAQLAKSWEYVFSNPVNADNLRFINHDEIVFTTLIGNFPQANIGFGKLNKNGSEDWYQEIDLGGNDYFYPPVIGSNNNIYTVGTSSQFDPFLSSFEQTLYTYSETGNLISSTILNKSSYVHLGDKLSSSTFKINQKGDVVSLTEPQWDITCSDGSKFIANSTFAVNYYNYGLGSYVWEDGAQKTDFEYRLARVAGFTSDGSVIVLEHLADWKNNNCSIDVNIPQVRSTYINKYNSSGSRVWRKDLAPIMGTIDTYSLKYTQNDTYAIISSNNSSGEYILAAVSLATGDIEWTKNFGTEIKPRNIAIHNNYLLLSTDYTDSGYKFYLFDIITGTELRTMTFTDRAFDDRSNNWFDDEGNIYLLNTVYYSEGLGDYGITCYDINFNQLWRYSFGKTRIFNIIEFDKFKNIYTYGRDISGNISWKIIKYSQGSSFTLKDANDDALSDKNFYLIRVADDAPLFTPDTLGIVKTDADGKIQLTPVQ